MKKVKFQLLLIVMPFSLLWLALAGCGQKKQATMPVPVSQKAVHTFSVMGSVREMNIVPDAVDFPEHEGKSEFMSYCAICHSLRHISMQPDFSRAIWDEEVHKMVIKYNAPIDSATCKKIVDYLVAVKGEKKNTDHAQ